MEVLNRSSRGGKFNKQPLTPHNKMNLIIATMFVRAYEA